MEAGYFLCADLLGFSSMVKNLTHEKLDEKIHTWTSLIEDAAKTHNIVRYQLLSDTVFASISNDKSGLKNLINFARHLLNYGVPQSLPIRGAISHGPFNWGEKLIYGRAVIEAHELEQKQNWLGVALVDGSNLTEIDYNDLGLVCYAIPMAPNCPIQNYSAIAWNVPTFEQLEILLIRDGLGGVPGVGKVLDWRWGDKVANTTIFGIYKNGLSKANKDLSKFHGHHPVHFIDLTMQSPS